jgi:two-component system, NarL family, response regulator LiaR
MSDKIRVIVADDHPIVRSGIRKELERHQGIEVVGEAEDGDEAFRLAITLHPDVLLLDIQMPGLKAAQLVQQLKRSLCPTRVLVLTAYGDLEYVLGMLKAGATGYLLKDEDPPVILDAVRAVAQGKRCLSNAVVQNLAGQVLKEALEPSLDALTEREAEVLRLVAQGQSNAEIAATLRISEGTVKNHVCNLYGKLGVDSRAEAVAWAWRHGMADKE